MSDDLEEEEMNMYNTTWLHVSKEMYRKARFQAGLARFKSLLKGSANRLHDLGTVLGASDEHSSSYVGIRSIPIHQIRGTESRSEDFDIEFNPLTPHNRWRWLSIANARQEGKALPLVELIQVGDDYFVRDGHHRISVAKAWGQDFIDAEVTARN